VEDTEAEAADFVFGFAQSGQEHDRVGAVRGSALSGRDVEAIHAGHTDVEQDQVRNVIQEIFQAEGPSERMMTGIPDPREVMDHL
jgi:hypothetical protein